jgi:integrase
VLQHRLEQHQFLKLLIRPGRRSQYPAPRSSLTSAILADTGCRFPQVTPSRFLSSSGSSGAPVTIDQRAPSTKVTALALESGVEPIGVHGLRHTWATLALESGVSAKVVQERLGHANIATTLDICSHVVRLRGFQAALW